MGRLKEYVETAQHHHRQDNLLVVALVEGVHQHIIGDVPDE